jgi:hypothetical protein
LNVEDQNVFIILDKHSSYDALQRQKTEISKQIFPEKEYPGLCREGFLLLPFND